MEKKIKKKKIDEARPPRDIQEKTKERRAWLAEKLAEVNATPNREGKIVGTGSYQVVSIYEVTEVEGRLRFRGHCQFCGAQQVVQNDRLVLHGYKRPGDGHIFNECPGIHQEALEVSKVLTTKWFESSVREHESAAKWLVEATAREERASAVIYADEFSSELRLEAFKNLPRANTFRKPTTEERAAYHEQLQAWKKTYPEVATYHDAQIERQNARDREWQSKSQMEHFYRLLNSGIFGTKYAREIVT